MAIIDTFGKCSCGEFNAMTAMKCHSCGSRLPWVSDHALSAARGQVAQASYWGAALSGAGATGATGGTASAATASASYSNDPDIDFTPLAGGISGNAGSSGRNMSGGAFYCTHCGSDLKVGQHICHNCRHLTTFTKADLRFTILISTLLVSGFLLGVVWTAVVINAANTGEWRLPAVKFTKTQNAPVKKPATKPSKPAQPVDEYGVPKS